MGVVELSRQDVSELRASLDRAEMELVQARARLDAAVAGSVEMPVLTAADRERVANVGEVAHRHLELKERGELTRASSRAVRREMYGDRVRSTANLFGPRGSNRLFYRDVAEDAPLRDSDPVELTEEGMRVALLWRALHPERV